MMGKQGLEEQGAKNALQQQTASQEAAARSGLASHAGLGAGAATSLAKANMRNQMTGLQGVGAQGALARANIGVQDEATKNQFLQQLPGQENQLAASTLSSQQNNVQQAMNENNAKRMADLNRYNKEMEVYGANKNANAMQSQSSGGKK
jgi:hypothetical protein